MFELLSDFIHAGPRIRLAWSLDQVTDTTNSFINTCDRWIRFLQHLFGSTVPILKALGAAMKRELKAEPSDDLSDEEGPDMFDDLSDEPLSDGEGPDMFDDLPDDRMRGAMLKQELS